MVNEKGEFVLLNIEKLYNTLKFELHRLKFENRELKKQIKKLQYNKDNETSTSGEEYETGKKI